MLDIEHGTLKSYIVGLTSCILLTLLAYFIVVAKLLTGIVLVISLVLLGLIQTWIQLVLFLHLGKSSKARSNLLVFLFMVVVLAIVFFGSLWIMFSLNERVMPNM